MNPLDRVTRHTIESELSAFLGDTDYPCVAAKSAHHRGNIELLLADDITRPTDDIELHRAVCAFGKRCGDALLQEGFHTLIAVFRQPLDLNEIEFEKALWCRLQNLHNFDIVNEQPWDERVDEQPESSHFSMSVGGNAFFVIGLHPQASRPGRRFAHPALVFNLNAQFEALRESGKFDIIQDIVRDRDAKVAGAINPMLANHGDAPEAAQYSGRAVDDDWECPFEPKPPAQKDA